MPQKLEAQRLESLDAERFWSQILVAEESTVCDEELNQQSNQSDIWFAVGGALLSSAP